MQFFDVVPALGKIILGRENFPLFPGEFGPPVGTIHTIWHAEITWVPHYRVGVSIVQSNEWQKGVLRTSNDGTLNHLPGTHDFQYRYSVVDLIDWNDPVITALHDIDVALASPRGRGLEAEYLFEFLIATDGFLNNIYHEELPKNPKMLNLFNQVLNTMDYCVTLCNDEEIKPVSRSLTNIRSLVNAS